MTRSRSRGAEYGIQRYLSLVLSPLWLKDSRLAEVWWTHFLNQTSSWWELRFSYSSQIGLEVPIMAHTRAKSCLTQKPRLGSLECVKTSAPPPELEMIFIGCNRTERFFHRELRHDILMWLILFLRQIWSIVFKRWMNTNLRNWLLKCGKSKVGIQRSRLVQVIVGLILSLKKAPFYQKHLIQAKRYSEDNKVGSPEVQQYSSLRQQQSDVDAVIIVSTSSFTSQAQQIADDLNVKLINGSDLLDLIKKQMHRNLSINIPTLRNRRQK